MDPKINTMTFKRIQHPETLKILSYHINGREVQISEYENKWYECHTQGKQYNSSLTTRNKQGNFVHTCNFT